MSISQPDIDISGPSAPPRANGELVFEAPWEGRAFGIVMTLCAQGVIEWAQFREHLITEIAGWENAPSPKPEWSYYTCWLAAMERVLTNCGALQSADIESLFLAFSARPHGHDHH